MANKLIRIYGRGHLHFITFSCYRRVPFLRSVRARNVFVQILGQVRDRYEFSLVGYVVMPDHVHLLIGEPTRGNAFHCDSSVETASLTLLAPQKESDRWTIEFELRKWRALTAANLVEKVLRLQCMESKKESRKAPLHAHEPVEEKTGRSPIGLALEQLSVLLESQTRIDPGRPSPLTRLKHRKSQTNRPFENREGAATRKFCPSSKAGPPATLKFKTAQEVGLPPAPFEAILPLR